MSEQNFTANQVTMIMIDRDMDQNGFGRGTDIAADCQNALIQSPPTRVYLSRTLYEDHS